MPDDTATTTAAAVIIPADVQASFGVIVDLIMHSESMNNGERQYWIDILPSMTQEQVQQLTDILTNERDQLAAIDAKYNTNIASSNTASIEETEMVRTRKREELSSKENTERSEEEKAAEDLLKQMD